MKLFFALISASLFFIAITTSQTSKKWYNWGDNQTCQPREIFAPATKQELIDIVQRARANNWHIHAYGSSHSWSDIVCTDYLINTDKLDKILEINKDKQTVKVEGGIKLYNLNEQLAQQNLTLANFGEIAAQSAAGATATATHGSGKTGTLASFIQELELITADGILHTLSVDTHREHFAAARTSLGALGIIYSLTFACQPLVRLKQERIVTDFATARAEYKQLRDNNDYSMFLWNPYTDKVLVFKTNKTLEDISHSSFWQKIKNKLFSSKLVRQLLVTLVDLAPSLTPRVIDSIYTQLESKGQVDYGYKILVQAQKSNDQVLYQEEEIAIAFDKLTEVAPAIKQLLLKYTQKGFYTTIWGVLFRFVNADTNNYLSPAADRDTVYVSITSSQLNLDFYKEYQDLMLKHGGRPHWGKINFTDHAQAQKLYGDNLTRFIKVREQLDPKGIFSNTFTKRVFGS
ncbi:FAD-binding protein [Candidatus Dependentiae bacterium]|nr:FAD-binding protein [Candidatus Dependentiae bacterium]